MLIIAIKKCDAERKFWEIERGRADKNRIYLKNNKTVLDNLVVFVLIFHVHLFLIRH